VDKGICDQLADGQLRVRPDDRSERLVDILFLDELIVDIADRLLETYGIALAVRVLLKRP
jgi:hypothetical protein